jgi:predicted restriction endonuclease
MQFIWFLSLFLNIFKNLGTNTFEMYKKINNGIIDLKFIMEEFDREFIINLNILCVIYAYIFRLFAIYITQNFRDGVSNYFLVKALILKHFMLIKKYTKK